MKDPYLPTPKLGLRRAAAKGELDDIQFIVKNYKELDINAVSSSNGKTALDWAIDMGHSEVADFLLSIGAMSKACVLD